MKYDDTTIVLPTYNEGKNIGKLIGMLLKSYPNISVLVVDDGSKDMTREVARKISRLYKNVKLFDRSEEGLERGLTNSIVDGLLLSRTKYAIVMDADLQHPAEKIADIKAALGRRNKIVVAYRAEVPGWALFRWIVSKSLIKIAYAVLVIRGGTRCRDIFSGYFGTETAFFKKVYLKNKQRFVGEGYKALFDLLKCIPDGSVKIAQVPYTFHVRMAGESKASSKQVLALFSSFLR
ncbi:MAG: glycosyltransferase [Candidatus Micrarchaeota archaeon]|nr:glycosyltransferase [Candidatus Micrarchaeota archaeon]MDE1805058.1 glycosyltransferase [Candidatus Micrarchaeota archaeon]MDE1847250.1 glycosyltransferase [Candidatus Micrarchaeota archaeon]